jgi:hypothetical protein
MYMSIPAINMYKPIDVGLHRPDPDGEPCKEVEGGHCSYESSLGMAQYIYDTVEDTGDPEAVWKALELMYERL